MSRFLHVKTIGDLKDEINSLFSDSRIVFENPPVTGDLILHSTDDNYQSLCGTIAGYCCEVKQKENYLTGYDTKIQIIIVQKRTIIPIPCEEKHKIEIQNEQEVESKSWLQRLIGAFYV